MPPRHLQSQRPPLESDTLLLMDLCSNKSNKSVFFSSLFLLLLVAEWRDVALCCRACVGETFGLHFSLKVCSISLALSLLFSFLSVCCVVFLGNEVKIAFALQVSHVGVYKWHYKQILLY